MRLIKLLGVSVVALAASGSAAFAKVTDQSKAGATSSAVSPLPKEGTLADNVVVDESRAERAVSSLPTDPVPTFKVALLNRSF